MRGIVVLDVSSAIFGEVRENLAEWNSRRASEVLFTNSPAAMLEKVKQDPNTIVVCSGSPTVHTGRPELVEARRHIVAAGGKGLLLAYIIYAVDSNQALFHAVIPCRQAERFDEHEVLINILVAINDETTEEDIRRIVTSTNRPR